MVLSTWATSTIEEVADCSPQGLKWFQMGVITNEVDNLNRIRRAERQGYKALVVTVDAPYRGMEHEFEMPPHLEYKNVDSFLDILKNIDIATPEEIAGVNPALTWELLPWLRFVSNGHVVRII